MAYLSPVDTPLATTKVPPAENSPIADESTTASSLTMPAMSAMSSLVSNSTIMDTIMADHASLTTTAPRTEDSRIVNGPTQLTSAFPLQANESPSRISPTLLTPSTSTSASEQAPSTCAYDKRTNVAKGARYQRAHIFGRTRQMMRHQTNNMLLTASRGYRRSGDPPTKATNPPMRERRHSIDVLTNNGGDAHQKGWEADHIKMAKTAFYFHETEPIIQRAPFLPFPNPCRYPCFGLRSAEHPPNDSSIYLELGTAVIHNDSFRFITNCDWPEAWMRDESLGMALEVLRRDQDCDKYSIGFADSNMTQTFHIAMASNDTGSRHYDSVRETFGDKRWIFLTINDGSGSLNDGGTHWSLVAMDRIHKQAHYIDSLFLHHADARSLGRDISLGLLQIIGENELEWTYNIEWNSPHQKFNNLYNWDSGPCGPVVYTMTKLLVDHIKSCQDAGREYECFLRLPEDFSSSFGQSFHSLMVRKDMARSIARWKVFTDSQILTTQHDQTAVAGEDVALLDTPDSPLLGLEPGSPRTNSSESVLEHVQDQDGGVALNDSNYMVISTSGSEYSEPSTVLSDPPHHIELDDPSETGEVVVVLEDVVRGSPPRLHHPGEYHSLNRHQGDENAHFRVSADVESASTRPTAPRVRPATPHHAGRHYEGQPLSAHTHGAPSSRRCRRRRRPRRHDGDSWSTDANP